MLSILKDIPSFALSCELDDFTILADKTVTIQFSLNGRVLFASSYVPDAKKEIHFLDLCSVIETYLTEEPLQRFNYMVTADSEQFIAKDFDVLLCRYGVSSSGEDFVQTHFLTSLQGRKYIGPRSTEYLYLTNPTTTSALTDPITVSCTYVTAGNQVQIEDVPFTHTGKVGINKLDVSPSKFAKPELTLVRYIVTCGSRHMRYEIYDRHTAAGIRFKNNFGCIETFTFAGTVEINPQVMRSAALVNGHRVNYDVRKEVHYKCYSSFIPSEMLFFADDIATSDDVAFVVDNQEYPVAVVESETPRTNSSSALNSFWIDFVPASRKGFMLPELTRIFDDTFDKTYN